MMAPGPPAGSGLRRGLQARRDEPGHEPGQVRGGGGRRPHPPARGAALERRHELHDRGRRDARDPRGPREGLREAAVATSSDEPGACRSLVGGRSARRPRRRRRAPPDANPIAHARLTLFAGTPTGLWLSRDWGATWERVDRAATDGLEAVGRGARRSSPSGRTRLRGRRRRPLRLGRFRPDLGAAGRARARAVHPALALSSTSTRPCSSAPATGLLKSVDAGPDVPRHRAARDAPVTRLEWPGPALVAATGRGVMVSNDGGASFTGPGAGAARGRRARPRRCPSFYPVDP